MSLAEASQPLRVPGRSSSSSSSSCGSGSRPYVVNGASACLETPAADARALVLREGSTPSWAWAAKARVARMVVTIERRILLLLTPADPTAEALIWPRFAVLVSSRLDRPIANAGDGRQPPPDDRLLSLNTDRN